MNSLTITAHALASRRRQGRARACAAYQPSTGPCRGDSGIAQILARAGACRCGTHDSRVVEVSVTRMSNVVSPRGPLPPRVYWRRRLVTLAVLVGIVVLVGRMFGGD